MVDEATRNKLDALVKARLLTNAAQIRHSLRQIAAGNPLGAEGDETRRVARLAIKTGVDRRQAEAISASIRQTAEGIEASPRRMVRPRRVAKLVAEPVSKAGRGTRPEAVWDTADFVGVEFFNRGRRAANAVGRVVFRSGRVQGTGFLVAPGVLLTNNHVIDSANAATAMCVQFDFELDESGFDRSATVFGFDAARCYAGSPIDALDFSLVAVGDRITGSKRLEDFGYLPLSDARDKHMLGELANIIQHPDGRPKQIVIRENNLVARDETTHVLHYRADTEPGSSGSPVFNNQWEPIAVHHWAGPHLETAGPDGRRLLIEVNEGIRISAIVQALRKGEGLNEARTRGTVTEVLQLWDASLRNGPAVPPATREQASSTTSAGARANPDGSISWIVPVEINVRVPAFSPKLAEPIVEPTAGAGVGERTVRTARSDAEALSDRGGYEPGFIHGFTVPMPDFSGVGYRIAKNLASSGADDRFELRYQHFSIVMNAERRLAAFTACNIDGSRIKAVNRQTKVVTSNPTLKDLGVESLGAESSDAFRPDDRVDINEQMGREFYEDQEVPGFAKPTFPAKSASDSVKKKYYRAMAERTARMLQKGHVVLRGDPAWGTDAEALLAEDDTFHYTNAAPQFGFFNQGSPDDHPGVKGKLRWRTIETYVLRNAVTERQRICVFAGPVFRKDDPDYRFESKLPLRFWKIAIWAADHQLHAVAVMADQGEVLKRLTQGVPEAVGSMNAAEAFDDPDELTRVSQYLTTIAEIERLTGLDFGDAVRNADIRTGEERGAVDDFDPNVTTKKGPSRSRRRGSPTRKR